MRLKNILTMITFAATATMAAQSPLPSGLDKNNMNLSAKPGTDFFEYAGGGWMKAHPLTAEYARYAQFDNCANSLKPWRPSRLPKARCNRKSAVSIA